MGGALRAQIQNLGVWDDNDAKYKLYWHLLQSITYLLIVPSTRRRRQQLCRTGASLCHSIISCQVL